MIRRISQRIADERGFTLVELLVVVLIIGILAATAIPSFINQRYKGQDAAAKSYARTAMTAQESWFTNAQSYTASLPNLQGIEPALNNYPDPTVTPTVAGAANTYSMTVRSKSGTTFTVARAANGVVTRSCTVPAGQYVGGCPSSSW